MAQEIMVEWRFILRVSKCEGAPNRRVLSSQSLSGSILFSVPFVLLSSYPQTWEPMLVFKTMQHPEGFITDVAPGLGLNFGMTPSLWMNSSHNSTWFWLYWALSCHSPTVPPDWQLHMHPPLGCHLSLPLHHWENGRKKWRTESGEKMMLGGGSGRSSIPPADPWLPPVLSATLYTCLGWVWWTHTLVHADPPRPRKNGKESDKPALPDTDSTMAFIFRVSSSVSRWIDCRWNLWRVSWPKCAWWPGKREVEHLAGTVDVCSFGGGGTGGGCRFFWMVVCMGVDSTRSTSGGPMLISRPRMSDGVGTMGSVMSSSQVNSKMFLMPLGTAMPEFRQTMSNLETSANNLGAMAVYCRYSSRLLLMFMLLEHAYC